MYQIVSFDAILEIAKSMHTDMVYHVFTKINFHIHVHTTDVPNCILRCNTRDCKIYAHQYGLPCIYKNKFSYTRTYKRCRDVPNCILRCNTIDCKIYSHRYGLRKPEKTPWEKILERVPQTMLQQ